MIKAVIFIEDQETQNIEYIEKEYKDSWELLGDYHDSFNNMSIKEVSFELNRSGIFITEIRSNKYKYYRSILLIPNPDYFGEQINFKTKIDKIKDFLFYDDVSRSWTLAITNYIISDIRNNKLKELGI